MPRYTGPNSASKQELDSILVDLETLSEEAEPGAQEAEALRQHDRLQHQREELARYEAAEALRRAAADKRSAERAHERAALNETISDALAPLRARPYGLRPEMVATMRRHLERIRSEAADKKSPSSPASADKTFPDLSNLTDAPARIGRTTHYVSKEREDIFFRELKRLSTGGHPFRDARVPDTGKSASVLLNTSSALVPFSPPPADKKSPTHTFKAPPPWRDLSPRGRAVYGIEAAKAGGRARAITINLGDAIKAKAPHQKHGALRFIMKAIDKGLKRTFDEAPPLFVTLEHSGDLGLHLHGIVELSDHQIKKVAKVIREAVGVWRERADRQVVIEPIYARGWASYITEDSAFMKEASGHRAYYMANDLRRRAEEIHKKDCDFIALNGGLTKKAVSQN